ncbi:MAG: glyoxalase [Alphaproteobacteria bacterium HGW-Alphaproteobacteria-11]|nr:MAG: glyoxalase [Alphaproteobacteria bacterium HGW-Alphaproteobacteria-11]
MEQRVSFITLGVADVARARAFYEALGWRALPQSNESVAFFQCGGIVFALFGRLALAEDAGLAPHGEGFSGFALAHNVREKDEVDATLAEAEAAGGKILKRGSDAFWGGYTGYFSDPDGHVWEVAWNPQGVIGTDGSFRFPEN